MSKNKKKKNSVNTDPRLAGNSPTANSAEFVPTPVPDIPEMPTYNAADNFDFIPDLKTDRFS